MTEEDLKAIRAAMREVLEDVLNARGVKPPPVLKAEGTAERMRRYRDRLRNAGVTKRNGKRNAPKREKRNASVTERNASVTTCECADETGLRIPLNDGSEYEVPGSLVKELETAYPICDVPQTLKEIRVWCIANPQKRKTKWGVTRFINSWMQRIQDKG